MRKNSYEFNVQTHVIDSGDYYPGQMRVNVNTQVWLGQYNTEMVSFATNGVDLTVEAAKLLIKQLQAAIELLEKDADADFIIHHTGTIELESDNGESIYSEV
jgi:hypothetical protein